MNRPDRRRPRAIYVRKQGWTADAHLEYRTVRDRALWHAVSSGAGVRLITLLLGVLTISVSVRSLESSSFGMVATLGTVLGLTGFADLGIGAGLMTRLAQVSGKNNQASMKPLISSALVSLGALGGLVAAIGSASTLILPWRVLLGSTGLPNAVITTSVVIFAISVGLAIPAGIGHRILLGIQKGTVANSWSLVASMAQFGAVLAAAWADAPVWAFVIATISTPVLVSCVESVWVLNRASHLRPGLDHISQDMVRHLLRVGGLFFALNLAVAVAYQTDMLIVSSVLGASSAAVFVIGLRMFGAVTGIFTLALQQLWPAFAEALSRGDIEWTRRRFTQVLAISTISIAGMSGLLVGIGQPLARIWVGNNLVPPLGLLIAFAAWTVYAHVMGQCSTLLNAAGVVGPQIAMSTAMVLLNLPLSIVLTKQIGLMGPLIGSLASHMICFGVPMGFLVRNVLHNGIRTARGT